MRVKEWWGQRPDFGVGVACGPAELIVIDIDDHDDALPPRDRILPGIPIPESVKLTGLANGFHALALLAALRDAPDPAADASTLRVRTPSGGLHVWYRTGGGRWLSSSGSGRRALAWQVDVRAGGGYIVAPGTVTSAGRYTPVGGYREPAPLPPWLAQELTRTGHAEVAVPALARRAVPPRARMAVASAGGDTPARRALETVLAEVEACGAVSHGAGFSEKLNRAAYTAGGLVEGGYLTAEEAEHALVETAERARPGQERRIQSIIRSGMAAGRARPLHPGGRP